MRSFRSNQRGRVQPAEYAGEVTKPQQRYGSRHRPRSAGASSRRYGSSRWPKPQYPQFHQYANVPAGRPSSAHYQQRPRTAGSRPSSGNTANVDAWLRARHGTATYGQPPQRAYGQSSGYGQRPRSASAAARPQKKEERREYYPSSVPPKAGAPRPSSASSSRQVHNNDTAHALLRQQQYQQERQEYVPPSQQQTSRPSSAAYALGTDKGYVVEREVSEQIKTPAAPVRAARPPVKPQADPSFCWQSSRPQSAGATRRPAPPTGEEPSVDDKNGVFKSRTNDPKCRWWCP